MIANIVFNGNSIRQFYLLKILVIYQLATFESGLLSFAECFKFLLQNFFWYRWQDRWQANIEYFTGFFI